MALYIHHPKPGSTVLENFIVQGTSNPDLQINGRINGKNAMTWATPSGEWILSFANVPRGANLTLLLAGDGPIVEVKGLTVVNAM